jgi:hypothetical protein
MDTGCYQPSWHLEGHKIATVSYSKGERANAAGKLFDEPGVQIRTEILQK